MSGTQLPALPAQGSTAWFAWAQAIHNATSTAVQPADQPTLATVATSGAYSDLTGLPALATVATTGSFADLVGSMLVDALPAGTTLTVIKPSGGSWPARPTARTDIVVCWKGADPSPPIVNSGTGGMLNNVDWRAVTP